MLALETYEAQIPVDTLLLYIDIDLTQNSL